MLNRVTLQGRLTADPELKTLPSGVEVCNFRIACQRNFKPKDAKDYPADFFNVTAWRGRAKFVANYFKKGDLILVDGNLQQDRYTDKDGNNRSQIIISADNIQFSGRRNADAEESRAAVGNEAPDLAVDGGDDLPF